MVKITCYGGVNEIGGNKILLEDGDTRIWLDFGMAFGQYNTYFEEFMKPRARHTGLTDFFEMGLLPDIEDLYAEDLLRLTGRDEDKDDEDDSDEHRRTRSTDADAADADVESVEDGQVMDADIDVELDRDDDEDAGSVYDAVLLSHAHDDHARYISFLDPEIPVYMSEVTYEIRETLEEVDQNGIANRVVRYRERDADGSLTDTEVVREIETFRHGARFSIGDVEVEPLRVDHSVPGSYGLILHTSDGPVVYTGDLRMHGRHGSWTERFVERARDVDPIAVIAEGTRITDTEKVGESEHQVREEMEQAVENTDGLVVVDYSYKDLDRFMSLAMVAQKTGRKLVVGTRAAYLYETYAEHIDDAPDTDDILYHLKQKSRLSDWEQPFHDSESGLTAEEIGERKDELILGFNQWKLNELIDVQPEDATYIRSMSEPYNEEMALDEERLRHWIDHFDMDWVRTHCSGHAPGQDLKEIIADIDADTIIPVHTEHPDAFDDLGDVEKPVQGRTIRIGSDASQKESAPLQQ